MNSRRKLLSAIAYCSALAGVAGLVPRQVFAASDRCELGKYPCRIILGARMLEIHALAKFVDECGREQKDLRAAYGIDEWYSRGFVGQYPPGYDEYRDKSNAIDERRAAHIDRLDYLERLPVDSLVCPAGEARQRS